MAKKRILGNATGPRAVLVFAGSSCVILLFRGFRAFQCLEQTSFEKFVQPLQYDNTHNRVFGQLLRKPRHHPVHPDSVFYGFQFASNLTRSSDNKPYCESKDRYRDLRLRESHRIVYLSGKMGHNNRFKEDIEKRQREATEKLHWLRNDSDAIFHYEVPEHWRNHETYKQHTQFLKDPTHESSTGGGWWFWKPPLILDALKELSPNDVLVFGDYDQTVWWPALADLIDYMITNPEIDWALTRWRHGMESARTKQDVFEAYCGKPTKTLLESPQWQAGMHIFRPTLRVKQFIEEWQRATEDYHAISDEKSLVANNPSFVEHRRDQSLLNMLHKCWFTSDEAKYIRAPHPCGLFYEKEYLDFYFVTLPPIKTPEELRLLEEQRHTFWASHNRTVPKADYHNSIKL
jgi:hypothetical protein